VPADGIGTLMVPAHVTLRGNASDGSYLYLQAASIEPEHYATGQALFRGLGMSHAGTATLDVWLEDGRVDHYADSPKQGLDTYMAALNAEDGKTLCRLWTPDVRARFTRDRYPCWATVSALIGYGGESDSNVFQRAELVRADGTYERNLYGLTFTAAPVTIRSYSRESRYSDKIVTADERTVIWFRKTTEGWRIAKDPLSEAGDGEGASVPPDPYAAQHAREAWQRKAEKLRAERKGSLIEPRRVPECPSPALVLKDPSGDVDHASLSPRPNGPGAGSDIRMTSLSLTGRRVCFTVAFQRRPMTGPQQISVTLFYLPRARPSGSRRTLSWTTTIRSTTVYMRDFMTLRGVPAR
jgi:hypothetical protein